MQGGKPVNFFCEVLLQGKKKYERQHTMEKSTVKVWFVVAWFFSWEKCFPPLVACMAPSSTMKANQQR